MALVLHKGEASVLGLVGGAGVDDDLYDAVRHFPHLRQDLLTLLGLGDAAHEEAAVVHAGAHAQETAVPEDVQDVTVLVCCNVFPQTSSSLKLTDNRHGLTDF